MSNITALGAGADNDRLRSMWEEKEKNGIYERVDSVMKTEIAKGS